MELNEAIRLRIQELAEERGVSISSVCLASGVTPSTVFDFLHGKSQYPKIITIKKLCVGFNITLQQFFAKQYFN